MEFMGVPARLSARFCASLQLNGELAHDLLELPAGYLKGRTGFAKSDGAPAMSGNGMAACPRLPAQTPSG
jgi:hypothetical protein